MFMPTANKEDMLAFGEVYNSLSKPLPPKLVLVPTEILPVECNAQLLQNDLEEEIKVSRVQISIVHILHHFNDDKLVQGELI